MFYNEILKEDITNDELNIISSYLKGGIEWDLLN
jgi:hypothetical protein